MDKEITNLADVVRDATLGTAGLRQVCFSVMSHLIAIYGQDYFEKELLPELIDAAVKDNKRQQYNFDQAIHKFREDIESELRGDI